MSDMVNHPDHFKSNKYECIDVMIDVYGKEATLNFCMLNAFKYLFRANKKHNTPTEDISKAVWYLNEYLNISVCKGD